MCVIADCDLCHLMCAFLLRTAAQFHQWIMRSRPGYNSSSAQEAAIWQSKEPVRPDQQQGLQKHCAGTPTEQFLPGTAEWRNSEQNARELHSH